MRREAAVLVVMAGLGLSFASCRCPEGQECVDRASLTPPPCSPGQECMKPPKTLGDEVHGCDAVDPKDGAALVKAKIALKLNGNGVCVVEPVRPERVCVMQGGAIRWKVKNDCDLSPDSEGVLKITKIDWLECDPRFTALERGEHKKNQLF